MCGAVLVREVRQPSPLLAAWFRHLTRLPILLLLVACGGDRSGRGPEIEAPRFALSDSPVLVLEDDGTPEKLFSRVSARRTPTGEVVVSDRGSLSIHVFDADGRVLRTIARQGGGPGELRGAPTIDLRGDTLLAFGMPLVSSSDVDVFSVTSGFVRREPLGAANHTGQLYGRASLGGGHYLVERGRGFSVLPDILEPGSLLPDSVTFGILPASPAEDREVVWLPRIQRGLLVAYNLVGGPVPVTVTALVTGHGTLTVASGERVWIVDTGTGELAAYDPSGQAVVLANLGLEPAPYEPAALERAREAALAAARMARDTLVAGAILDPSVLPATMPFVDQAYAGADGEVWLRIFTLEPDVPQHFLGLDRDGARVGQVAVPAGIQVEQFGEDFVVGVRRDEMDVERVVVYSIVR